MQLHNAVFNKYSALVGSDQIATKFALRIIENHLNQFNPNSILEIGSGIGTITELLIKKSTTENITCYESNQWCLAQLVKNIDKKQIRIITTIKELIEIKKINFLIIDEYLDEKTTFILVSQTKPDSIFIEGHRRRQRLFFIKSFNSLGWSYDFKNYRKSYDSNKGGCMITHIPGSSHKKNFYYVFILVSLFIAELSIIRSKLSIRQYLLKFMIKIRMKKL